MNCVCITCIVSCPELHWCWDHLRKEVAFLHGGDKDNDYGVDDENNSVLCWMGAHWTCCNVQSTSILFTLLACYKYLTRMGIMMVNAKGDAFPSGDQILVLRQCFGKVFTRYPAWPYSNDTPSRSLWIRSIDKKMYAASEKKTQMKVKVLEQASRKFN